ncbi:MULTISPECIES: hypothetical protein [unclassified Microbacterium]|uniref:hypothetical protein n=1 Tax=unclassified Microbacterium TaxID=2609290 RepID=UPI003744F847
MPDPRRATLSTAALVLRPADAPEQWEVSASAPGSGSDTVSAHWGDWVRLAKRILDTDALSRELEGRGDAWDQGHAAGLADADGADAVNPFR